MKKMENHLKNHIIKTKYSTNASIFQMFDLVSAVAKHPFTVKIGKKERFYEPPKKIKISKKLFRGGDNCQEYGCAKCCGWTGFCNVLSPNGLFALNHKHEQESFNYSVITILIGTDAHQVFLYNHKDETCSHLDYPNCTIVGYEPVHCLFRTLKLKWRKDRIYVTKEPMGRNFILNCPIIFKPMDENDYLKVKTALHRLGNFATECGISHNIDVILAGIEQMWEEYQEYMKVYLKEPEYNNKHFTWNDE
jgi:hypothetical protein